jgi:hypothetical protein
MVFGIPLQQLVHSIDNEFDIQVVKIKQNLKLRSALSRSFFAVVGGAHAYVPRRSATCVLWIYVLMEFQWPD